MSNDERTGRAVKCFCGKKEASAGSIHHRDCPMSQATPPVAKQAEGRPSDAEVDEAARIVDDVCRRYADKVSAKMSGDVVRKLLAHTQRLEAQDCGGCCCERAEAAEKELALADEEIADWRAKHGMLEELLRATRKLVDAPIRKRIAQLEAEREEARNAFGVAGFHGQVLMDNVLAVLVEVAETQKLKKNTRAELQGILEEAVSNATYSLRNERDQLRTQLAERDSGGERRTYWDVIWFPAGERKVHSHHWESHDMAEVARIGAAEWSCEPAPFIECVTEIRQPLSAAAVEVGDE